MKTAKTIILVLALGMFGYVYADQNSPTSTEKPQPAARACKMAAKDAACCKGGESCCAGGDCCNGGECCKGGNCCQGGDCCIPGGECCKPGAECCKAGGDCCKGGACCSTTATADADHKAHTAKPAGAACNAAGGGCCVAKVTKK